MPYEEQELYGGSIRAQRIRLEELLAPLPRFRACFAVIPDSLRPWLTTRIEFKCTERDLIDFEGGSELGHEIVSEMRESGLCAELSSDAR